MFTKQQEQTDDEEGLLEKSIERQPMYFRYSGGQKSESSQYDFTFHWYTMYSYTTYHFIIYLKNSWFLIG